MNHVIMSLKSAIILEKVLSKVDGMNSIIPMAFQEIN